MLKIRVSSYIIVNHCKNKKAIELASGITGTKSNL